MKVTLRQLEVFAAVASHGQVTRAADAVALSQAAASMALADLERQLDGRLFDRVGRQLLLNEQGRRLLPRALEILDRVRDLESAARSGGSAFDLKLGASLTIGNHLLPGLLAGMQQRHPGSRLGLALHNTAQVVAELLAFRIDLGFVEGPVQEAAIRRLPWHQDRLVVFAGPGHPLAGRVVTQAELAGAGWVLRERGSGTREVFERAMANATLSPRLALELEQPEAIRQCVRRGLGLGCLSRLELQESFDQGSLLPVYTPFLDLGREFLILVHRERHLSQGLLALLALCGLEI